MRLLVIAFLVVAQTPDNLKPPLTEKLAFTAHATGDQIYTCDGANWTFTSPEAKLFDKTGRQIGSHFAGPTWESFDGSRVIGRAVANVTPDAHSIPWLLLAAANHEGSGVMSNVLSIQRLNTKGGKAPASGCDASHKGEKASVHYTADYLFFTKN